MLIMHLFWLGAMLTLPSFQPQEAKAGDGFPFPDDRGGQLLSKMLPPDHGSFRLVEEPAAPRHLAPPAALEHPMLPLPLSQATVPQAPVRASQQPLRPRPLPDELPLTGYKAVPPPEEPRLPAGERVRQPSIDLKQPVPLPILATPVSDRASLEDPTGELSATMALSATPPDRQTPAPVLRLTLPDPFELRHAVKVQEAPPEDANPVMGPPRPPN